MDRARAELEALSPAELQARVDEEYARLARELAAKQAAKLEARARLWPKWSKKDLWSQAELAEICCGRVPGEPERNDADQIEINAAVEDISRGVLARKLVPVQRSDADAASRLYNSHRHFEPIVASQWAAQRFDQFPAALLELLQAGKSIVGESSPAESRSDPPPSAGKPLDPRERVTLLVVIGALAHEAGIDLSEPFKAGGQIEAKLQAMGLDPAPTQSTIGRHLKAVSEALDSRKG